ncbi:IS3 family transposase [Phormidium sp. FACHB-77]
MCWVLKQSRSGYYTWCNCLASPGIQENELLFHQIQQVYDTSCQSYGSPRIQVALVAQGVSVSRQRVVRLMAKLGISARSRHKFQVTADSKHARPIAENHLNKDFVTSEPDRVGWLT